MIAVLPPELSEWAPWLDLLPAESALALGPLVRRLSAALGPLRVTPDAGLVEPDGFDGLARHGHPERLLLSEWLLADVEPLEFLRRAANGEQAHLKLARRDPHAALSSVALFDAGPNQLGNPRLAQVAALFVMSRRASAAGAQFAWGVWQRAGELHQTIDRPSLEWLLQLRGAKEVTRADWENWAQFWEANQGKDNGEKVVPLSNDEIWLIGGAKAKDARELMPRARVLELGDDWDLDSDLAQTSVPASPDAATVLDTPSQKVSARIAITGAPDVRFQLELPAPASAARLMRDPFMATRPALPAPTSTKRGKSITPRSNLVWGQSGYKLFARGDTNDLLSYAVPNSPHASAGKPKKFDAFGLLVGAGRVQGATVAAAFRSDGRMILEAWGKNGGKWPTGQFEFRPALSARYLEAARTGALSTIVPVEGLDANAFAVLIQGIGNLKIWKKGENTPIQSIDGGVLAMQSVTNGLQFVWHNDYKDTTFLSEISNVTESSTKELPEITGVFVAHGAPATWAFETPDGWEVHHKEFSTPYRIASDVHVEGALRLINGEIGLICVRDEDNSLWSYGPKSSSELCRLAEPILDLAPCPFAPIVALRTESEVVVYSLLYKTFLMRVKTE